MRQASAGGAALAAALLLAGAAGPVLPGVGPGERRQRVPAEAPPWRAVARLQVPGVGRCTAVLIAPRLAVTAAHCLWGRALGRFVPPGAVHVLAGYASGAFARHAVAVAFRVAGGFDPLDPAGTRGADLAVVTLAGPMADMLALADETPGPGTAAWLGGYNQDRAEVIEADLHCAVTGQGADRGGRALVAHDCLATRGTSGAPLLVPAADGTVRVAGVQVAARIAGAGGFAVPVATVRRLIEQP